MKPDILDRNASAGPSSGPVVRSDGRALAAGGAQGVDVDGAQQLARQVHPSRSPTPPAPGRYPPVPQIPLSAIPGATVAASGALALRSDAEMDDVLASHTARSLSVAQGLVDFLTGPVDSRSQSSAVAGMPAVPPPPCTTASAGVRAPDEADHESSGQEAR